MPSMFDYVLEFSHEVLGDIHILDFSELTLAPDTLQKKYQEHPL